MTKFVQCKTKADVIEKYGHDWFKIIKVDGGYMLFDTRQDYQTWIKQN